MTENLKKMIERIFLSKLGEETSKELEIVMTKKDAGIMVLSLLENTIEDIKYVKDLGKQNMVILKKFGELKTTNMFNLINIMSFDRGNLNSLNFKENLSQSDSLLMSKYFELIKKTFFKKSGEIAKEEKKKPSKRNNLMEQLKANKIDLKEIEKILTSESDFKEDDEISLMIIENINMNTRLEMLKSNIFDSDYNDLKVKFNFFISFLKRNFKDILNEKENKVCKEVKNEIKKLSVLFHLRGKLNSLF